MHRHLFFRSAATLAAALPSVALSQGSTSERLDALEARVLHLESLTATTKAAWVCGEVLIDRLPPATTGGERINVVGGGAANTAKALAHVGPPQVGVDFVLAQEAWSNQVLQIRAIDLLTHLLFRKNFQLTRMLTVALVLTRIIVEN